MTPDDRESPASSMSASARPAAPRGDSSTSRYDILDDTPVGALLLGVCDARALPRLTSTRSERELDEASRASSAPRAPLAARRRWTARSSSSTSTSPGRRHGFDLRARPARGAGLPRARAAELAPRPVRHEDTYGASRGAGRAPEGGPRGRHGDEPQPDADRPSRATAIIGANGSLTGYGGGLDVKERLLRLEGAALVRLGHRAELLPHAPRVHDPVGEPRRRELATDAGGVRLERSRWDVRPETPDIAEQLLACEDAVGV